MFFPLLIPFSPLGSCTIAKIVKAKNLNWPHVWLETDSLSLSLSLVMFKRT